jgi:hypothetical protein
MPFLNVSDNGKIPGIFDHRSSLFTRIQVSHSCRKDNRSNSYLPARYRPCFSTSQTHHVAFAKTKIPPQNGINNASPPPFPRPLSKSKSNDSLRACTGVCNVLKPGPYRSIKDHEDILRRTFERTGFVRRSGTDQTFCLSGTHGAVFQTFYALHIQLIPSN